MYGEDRPEDTEFWSGGEEVVFDDDVDVWYAVIYRSRAEIVGVFPDRDQAKEVANKCGLPGSEWGITPCPADFTPDDYDFPNLP